MLTGEPVFTISEVAGALRVSDETIRRKIDAGELDAIKISSTPRRTYRILYRDLAQWLGKDKAEALFRTGEAFDEFRTLFIDMDDEARNKLIQEALAWAKERRIKAKSTGKVLNPKAIKQRFS